MSVLKKFIAGALAGVILTCSYFPAGAADKRFDKSYSPEACLVKNSVIDVKVDAEKHRISGTVKIKFQNNTEKTLTKLCVRNYAASILGKKGSSVLSGAKLGKQKLSLTAKKDKSVLYARLGKNTLKQGKGGTLSLSFKTDIPKKNDRFGYHGKRGNYFIQLSYCFPELASWVDGKWAEYPYAHYGESNFNRMSDYSITVHAPSYLKVLSVGDEKQNGSVTKISAKKIRDVAIVLSDKLKLTTKKSDGVRVNYYVVDNEHMKDYNRCGLDAAVDSLKTYTKHFGAYPYKELDVVSCYSGGMEFSGLVMCRLPDLGSLDQTDTYAVYFENALTISHEIAHQWFYNLVGSNPYSEPWLDEAFAEYCEIHLWQFGGSDTVKKIIKADRDRGIDNSFTKKIYYVFEKAGYEARYLRKYNGKINYPYISFKERDDYDAVVYHNGAYFIRLLRKAMGDRDFFRTMKDYCDTFAFKEAAGTDFVSMVYKHNSSKRVKAVIKQFLG